MAAPSGIVWGSTVGSYGRIGLYVNVTTNNSTTYAGTVDIWFWSKYSVNDTNNTLYYDNLAASGSATTSKGGLTVKTTSDSGGWSTTNQIELKSYSFSYTKGTSAVKRYLYAKLANIDRVGGTMYASTTLTVPKLASYTIAYNANGGSNAPSSQTKWYGKNLTLSTTKPTRTGYAFQGWSTANDSSVEYGVGDSYTANSGVTLYAVWKANTYTVKYDANGGTGAPSNQTKTYGTALTLSSTKPTRTNYNFKGWGTSASATSVAYAAGASYTTNAAVTLYAIWELAYTKPRITGLSISRCDSTGTTSDDGTYALIKFNWAIDSDKTISSIAVEWSPATSASPTTIAASGTSGSVNKVIGNGTLSAETTYTVTLTVEDSGGKNEVKRTLNGQAFPIDFKKGNKGVAFGKPAELDGYVDFKYKQFLRDAAEFANDKSIMGTDTDGTAYSALIPVSASGNTSLGYGLYKAGKGHTHIYGNDIQFYTNNGIFTNGNKVVMDNDKPIVGYDANGNEKRAFTAVSENGNTVIGYDNYAQESGTTNIYGHDINHFVSNIATPGSYRPYRRKGDTMTLTINTAGYVTNSGTEVWFFIPLSVPLVGSPTVTLSSGDGLILRQGGKYTHGSGAGAAVSPNSYAVNRYMFHGITVKATFSNTTNVTNNDAIGIMWNGTITLS